MAEPEPSPADDSLIEKAKKGIQAFIQRIADAAITQPDLNPNGPELPPPTEEGISHECPPPAPSATA